MDISGKKRGQVTIFIIVAIVIIGIAVLLYLLTSGAGVTTTAEFDVKNPTVFIQSCLEDDVEDSVETISLQGGSIEPEHYFLYQGDKIEYLCYTEEYYVTCGVQQPLLKAHVEDEIENEISGEVVDCFNQLKDNYERKGYDVQLETGVAKVELLPRRIVVTFGYDLTVSKAETERYNSFNVILNNNLYELVSIASSIVEWESTYGDAETTIYMAYYPDLKVEKKKQGDGSTIYILTDRDSENKFQFASRSVAWP